VLNVFIVFFCNDVTGVIDTLSLCYQ